MDIKKIGYRALEFIISGVLSIFISIWINNGMHLFFKDYFWTMPLIGLGCYVVGSLIKNELVSWIFIMVGLLIVHSWFYTIDLVCFVVLCLLLVLMNWDVWRWERMRRDALIEG